MQKKVPENLVLLYKLMKLPLLLMGGGLNLSPLFLFVKTIEKVIRLCTVLIFFLSGSFEDMGIFHVYIYLSVMDRYTPPSKIS